jgi:8-oxo-dGTP diphosphatase
VAEADGNGWVSCRCGRRHWGLHGAAGLLLVRDGDEGLEVLLQLRSGWTHDGGTWGLPGGARDSHESAAVAALREAAEECAIDPSAARVVAQEPGLDHGTWSYTYVVAVADGTLTARVANEESDELRWVRPDDVPALGLHPGLAQAWPRLHRLVVDAGAGLSPRTAPVREW